FYGCRSLDVPFLERVQVLQVCPRDLQGAGDLSPQSARFCSIRALGVLWPFRTEVRRGAQQSPFLDRWDARAPFLSIHVQERHRAIAKPQMKWSGVVGTLSSRGS